MQEKVTRSAILQRRRLGCQTQRFRRPVGLLGFQLNLPVVSLFPVFHYIYRIVKKTSGRLKTFQTACLMLDCII